MAALLLRWVLRLVGISLLSALLAVFLPTAWMARIQEFLGLGLMPQAPIVEYLTRSISLLYALHGGVMLVAASDLKRHARVTTYVGGVGVAFGAAMIAIDLYAGMPWAWTLFEGPGVIALGALVLWLNHRVRCTAVPGVEFT